MPRAVARSPNRLSREKGSPLGEALTQALPFLTVSIQRCRPIVLAVSAEEWAISAVFGSMLRRLTRL
jgi:hypothetical protein